MDGYLRGRRVEREDCERVAYSRAILFLSSLQRPHLLAAGTEGRDALDVRREQHLNVEREER